MSAGEETGDDPSGQCAWCEDADATENSRFCKECEQLGIPVRRVFGSLLAGGRR